MSTVKESIFRTKSHVDLRDVDFTRHLKLSSLFSYFQDVASLAADHLGYGIERLAKEFGVAWILLRIRVDIERMPKWDEEMTIETWPIEPNRVEFQRDFLVRDKNGNIIIRAVSVWVIMDLKERRLKRAETIGLQYPEKIKERAIDVRLGKLKGFGQLKEVYKKVIGYSDIDFNGHLNNSKYVDFIMDCFSIDEHKQNQIQSIEMHFINEALPGDTITIYKEHSNSNTGLFFIEGMNEMDNKTVFKVLVHLSRKS
ncbi:acyl-[acyl-carrier-protein] thioesterase [Pallidibacillus thermolactis]|jgi:medium-chain acyl-[acyl-carrier-protein] hydrolase|uniref:acyl-[acyl-carrier-protein] thioesterase n=1 Tax=Pallidibacillus thermolactis TaxID=251051 RepID=UPI0021DA9EE0|nr:acyl-ACP thioesterase domain-containing protein [Pallidibacillus thermolactis]MCU9600674.1 thioesterase [Pallidibacillus thermolactis subsp. kokeshiiformis]